VFTGIIQHVGRVVGSAPGPGGRRLRIDVGPLAERLRPGSSLAVDGACLTVSALRGPEADFDVVPETLGRSTLGRLRAGDRVNLEPALPAGAPLDGHLVQGHVDGVAEVVAIDRRGQAHEVRLRAAAELTAQMVPKGSVALAGVSLTLVEVQEAAFSVALVPTTLRETTLGGLRLSDRVNVELDIIGKYVRRAVEGLSDAGGLTMEKLRRTGFA